MSRESMVFLFGILIIVTPFLGVAREVKQYLYIAIGTILLFLGFSLRRSAYMRTLEREKGQFTATAFQESQVGLGRTPSLNVPGTHHIS